MSRATSPYMRKLTRRGVAASFLAVALLMSACNESSSSRDSAPAPEVDQTPVAAFSLMETTISDIHSALEAGTTSCHQLVQDYLDRINTYDKATALNAIVMTNPAALARADEIDQRLAAGDILGELYCVPVLVKDNYDTKDMPTTGGVLALGKSMPPDDSYVVQQLRDADAIVLAKTNMDEFAFHAAHTVSSVVGITRNAYGLDRTPAGSSGGTASGVAANFGAIGLGSDTGNSIRGPSSHASLVGLRSTMGLISRDGVIPLNLDRDMTGSMTRTVEDLARTLNVIAGYDPADPITALSEGHVPEDYTTFLDANGLKGARIGVFRQLTDDTADPEVVALFENAIADLRRLGAEIVDPFEVANYNEALNGAETCSNFKFYMNRYLASLTSNPAVPATLDELVATGMYEGIHATQLKELAQVAATPEEQGCIGVAGDIANNPGRQAFRDTMIAAMNQANVDVIVYPTWDNAPQPLGNLANLPPNKGDNSQGLAPYSGQPAITVPMGFNSDGLPLGLQIFGRPFAEPTLIKYAYAYEQSTHHRVPPPLYPSLK